MSTHDERQLGQMPGLSDLDWELECFVEKFEQAMAVAPQVDVLDYLPDDQHPRFADIACELLRVDMELAATTGRDFSLAQYRRRMPHVFQAGLDIKTLQSEESRLRQQIAAQSSATLATAPAQPSAPEHRLPNLGESVCGFDIVEELGRGAFSRVYLALDNSLSQRRVVLKLSSELPGEAQTLSRLQHKNIVPVYSLHRHGAYHAICMPFLGAMTLADLLRSRDSGDQPPLSGRALVSTLAARAERTWTTRKPASTTSNDSSTGSQISSTESRQPGTSSFSRFDQAECAAGGQDVASGLSEQQMDSLSRMSTGEVALWLVSELADGLQHAHERGILHRDIKPANVLISDDGLPMLLDFNLAAQSQSADSEQLFGGTLRYMSPEHLAAVKQRQGVLDARADVYSLGIVLFELLARRPAYPDRSGEIQSTLGQMISDRQTLPALVIDWNSGLTPAVIRILERAVAPLPADRYQTAAQFRDDLRLQLEHKPLQYARDTSLRERIGKWNARHPRLSALTLASTVASIILVVVVARFLTRQAHLERIEAANWMSSIVQAQSPARTLLVSQSVPTVEIDQLLESSKAILDPSQAARHLSRMAPEIATEARSHLARLHFWRARANGAMVRREPQKQADWLQGVIFELREANRYDAAIVSSDWIKTLEPLAQAAADRTADEWHDASGKLLSRFGSEEELLQAELDQALKAESAEASNPWHWLSLGSLQLATGRQSEALTSFTLSHSLNRKHPLAPFYLGVIETRRKDFAAAEQWFGRALELRPEWDEALMNRAAVRFELGKYESALEDLVLMAPHGKKLPRSFFIREMVLTRMGRRDEAAEVRKQGMALEPNDALAWNARGLARLRNSPSDAAGALADFEEAIALDITLCQAYENAAHVLAERLQRPDEAIVRLDRVIELEPNYALARAGRAVLHARVQRTEQALADVEQVLALDRSPMICYMAASALALLPEQPPAKAIDLLREALRKDVKLAQLMQKDRDLGDVQNHPRFREILAAAKALQ